MINEEEETNFIFLEASTSMENSAIPSTPSGFLGASTSNENALEILETDRKRKFVDDMKGDEIKIETKQRRMPITEVQRAVLEQELANAQRTAGILDKFEHVLDKLEWFIDKLDV